MPSIQGCSIHELNKSHRTLGAITARNSVLMFSPSELPHLALHWNASLGIRNCVGFLLQRRLPCFPIWLESMTCGRIRETTPPASGRVDLPHFQLYSQCLSLASLAFPCHFHPHPHPHPLPLHQAALLKVLSVNWSFPAHGIINYRCWESAFRNNGQLAWVSCVLCMASMPIYNTMCRELQWIGNFKNKRKNSSFSTEVWETLQ